jgi:hypothetical protein
VSTSPFSAEVLKDYQTQAFSIRRLNPFRGMLQVFQFDSARALSANGLVWEIQVLSDRPQGLWANMPFSGRQFYTFGLWSADTGMSQVPINPLFNIRDMIDSAELLLEGLRPALDGLPFPLGDTFEAWLLDEQGQEPLALLLSCRSETERRQITIPKWVAAERGVFGFVSQHLLDRGLPNNDGYNPRVHASFLEAMVRERVGQHACCVWYRRHADGSASPCDVPQTRVAADHFPELPIRESWPNQKEVDLINDYIGWLAPQLLMLPSLQNTTRKRLERLAVNQALEVDRLWRLYPEIHDQALLNSARVEAKIRSASSY